MYTKYVISKGDNLSNIAKKFNTLESAILSVNDMRANSYLREGMEIVVPESKKSYFDFYTIKSGDSLYEVARSYNINPELLAVLNGLDLDDYIYPGQKIMVPKAGYSYYITKEGDTIEMVAEKFRISKDSLMSQNDVIYLSDGQLLVNKNR